VRLQRKFDLLWPITFGDKPLIVKTLSLSPSSRACWVSGSNMRLMGVSLLTVWLLLGCTTQRGPAAEKQIRERIATIRTSILAKEPEGIIRWGTDDWTFVGPDGNAYNKATYLVRARDLFNRIVTVDALDTQVDKIVVQGAAAEVEITQTMERHERDTSTGKILHLRLRYRERHTWVRVDGEWRVRSVSFLGAPERTEIGSS